MSVAVDCAYALVRASEGPRTEASALLGARGSNNSLATAAVSFVGAVQLRWVGAEPGLVKVGTRQVTGPSETAAGSADQERDRSTQGRG